MKLKIIPKQHAHKTLNTTRFSGADIIFPTNKQCPHCGAPIAARINGQHCAIYGTQPHPHPTQKQIAPN